MACRSSGDSSAVNTKATSAVPFPAVRLALQRSAAFCKAQAYYLQDRQDVRLMRDALQGSLPRGCVLFESWELLRDMQDQICICGVDWGD